MVARAFNGQILQPADVVLDPGCGNGAFIAGVLRYCEKRGWPAPKIVGIEMDAALAEQARHRFGDRPQVEILQQDLLITDLGVFDFVIGNPPYVLSITHKYWGHG